MAQDTFVIIHCQPQYSVQGLWHSTHSYPSFANLSTGYWTHDRGYICNYSLPTLEQSTGPQAQDMFVTDPANSITV
jgi:hypothetical protein